MYVGMYECMFVYILYTKAFDIDIILYSYIHTDGTYIHTYIQYEIR